MMDLRVSLGINLGFVAIFLGLMLSSIFLLLACQMDCLYCLGMNYSAGIKIEMYELGCHSQNHFAGYLCLLEGGHFTMIRQ